MELQHIRNASFKLYYHGKTILMDPMLCPKDTFPPFVKGLRPNPTVDLVMKPEDIINDIEIVGVTHTHPDHFCPVSASMIPKDTPLFHSIEDQGFERFESFKQCMAIQTSLTWEHITITRVPAQHGSGPVLPYMGKVSGYVLQADNAPTVYITGDSILYESMEETIDAFRPDIIICNAGGGIIPGFEQFPVMMDEKQIITMTQRYPETKIVALHLESIDFCRVTREGLRAYAHSHHITEEQLLIPKDGEILSF